MCEYTHTQGTDIAVFLSCFLSFFLSDTYTRIDLLCCSVLQCIDTACVCGYTHIHVYIRVYMYTYTQIHIYRCISIYVCVDTHIYCAHILRTYTTRITHTHTQKTTHVLRVWIHTYTRIHTSIHKYTYIDAYLYTCIHTRRRPT